MGRLAREGANVSRRVDARGEILHGYRYVELRSVAELNLPALHSDQGNRPSCQAWTKG